MSFLTSTGLARPQYTIAIAGITGNLGKSVAEALLKSYKPFFSTVIGLVRDPSSAGAKSLADSGVDIRKISENDSADSVTSVLGKVDVVVNLLNSNAAAFKDVIAEAAVKAGASVYFLSEFGVDHRLNDFPGFEHHEWIHKLKVEQTARKLAGDKVKVISIYSGFFTEGSAGPWFGFDTANRTYTSIGDPSQRFSLTSKYDIGRTIAELSLLSLGTNAATVPDHVRIGGNTVAFEEVATILRKVRKELGKEDLEITIKSEDLVAFREKTKARQAADPKSDPLWHLRIILGENKLDFSADNSNELVNPGGKVWKWKTLEDFFREIDGTPFGA